MVGFHKNLQEPSDEDKFRMLQFLLSDNCETCGEYYTKPPTMRARVCSNGFHCCRDCHWDNGVIIRMCKECKDVEQNNSWNM